MFDKKIANVYQFCQMCCGVIPNPDVYNFTKAAVDLELFKIDRRITKEKDVLSQLEL